MTERHKKLAEFIHELQEVEKALPGTEVHFYIKYLAGDYELSEELTEREVRPAEACIITFNVRG